MTIYNSGMTYKKGDIKMEHDVIILGSGPAGCTAAIYAARSRLKPLLIEGPEPGGQLTITTTIENFPGFPDGVTGPKLMQDMKDQAIKYGTKVLSALVTKVDFSKKPFTIYTDSEKFNSKTVIIATGASAKWIGLEAEKKLMGKGVSGCATCDGFFFRDQEVVVVGGGDTAIEDAIFLTKFASKVTIVHRRDELRASKIMQDKVKTNNKIHFEWNKVVVDIMDVKQGKVTGVKFKDVLTNQTHDVKCDGVFVAIGRKPNTDLFKDQINLNEQGYIITNKKNTCTNIAGVFAAGDVQDPEYRQAILAAGTGCMAAIDAERYIG